MIDVQATFAEIRKASRQPGLFKTMPTHVREPGDDAFVAVDVQDRLAVLIPTDNPPVAAVWIGKALSVELNEALSIAAHTTLIVRCLSRLMEEEFILLVTEILSTLQSETGDGGRLAAVVLEKWRLLFTADPPSVLGSEALSGLFGELTDLQRLVEAIGPAALSVWTGPDSARHDFEFDDGDAVEVKATTSVNTMEPTIHGIRQLESPSSGNLYLSFHLLERRSAGKSIPDLVKQIAAMGVDIHELHDKLRNAGYLEVHEHHYSQIRFAPLEHRLYWVDENFPRITPETLLTDHAAIGNVRYTVNLAGVPELPTGKGNAALKAIR